MEVKNFEFKNRICDYPNRKKIKILKQDANELTAEIEDVEGNVTQEGTAIDAKLFDEFYKDINDAIQASNSAETIANNANETAKYAQERVDYLDENIAQAKGTVVLIGNEKQSDVNFSSDPQTQIDNTWKLLDATVIPEGADLNTYKQIGNYSAKDSVATILNKPNGLSSGFVMKVYSADGVNEGALNIIQEISNVNNERFTRAFVENNWSEWEKVLTSKGGKTTGLVELSGGANIWNGNRATYLEFGKFGDSGIEFHAQPASSGAFVDYDAMIQARNATSTTGSGSASFRFVAREYDFERGPVNLYGKLNLSADGLQTNSPHGYRMNEFGNFLHLRSEPTDYWHIDGYDNKERLKYYFETGKMYLNDNEVETVKENLVNQKTIQNDDRTFSKGGCIVYSSGLQICWGITPLKESTKVINFDRAFNSRETMSVVCKRGPGQNGQVDWDKSQISEITTSNFTLTDSSARSEVAWIAIGQAKI